MSTPTPIAIVDKAPYSEEQKIKSLWTALQVAEKQIEKRGLQFGQAMYEYREKHSAQGRRTDLSSSEEKLETFGQFCERTAIPRSTADRWIARYEETIGERQPATVASVMPIEINLSPQFAMPSAPEPCPLVTQDQQDIESLTHLAKRFTSITTAVQQILENKNRWKAQADAYAAAVSSAHSLATLIKQL